ncbi:MAG: tyrosine-type recombinase/integrase [Kouleothrix sp.]|nr:tyrosine-type recombinase/integrase [Kouleothrix sp.]
MTVLSEAVAAFLEHRRLAGRSTQTIARYTSALTMWQRWREAATLDGDIQAITIAELRDYLSYLLTERIPHDGNVRRAPAATSGLAPHSVANARTVLRAFWTFAGREGWLLPDQLDFFCGDRIPKIHIELEDRAYWRDDLVEQLLAACDHAAEEDRRRVRAIIALLYESGLRIDELCSLTDEQIDVHEQAARVRGKGRKKRWVFWGEDAATELAAYLAVRRGASGGSLPLFRGTSPKNDGGALSTHAVRAAIKRVAKRAQIDLPKGAPIHASRHGFAHAMIDGGAPLSNVTDLLGHADPRITMRYLHERKDRLQEVHRRAQERRRRAPDHGE